MIPRLYFFYLAIFRFNIVFQTPRASQGGSQDHLSICFPQTSLNLIYIRQ